MTLSKLINTIFSKICSIEKEHSTTFCNVFSHTFRICCHSWERDSSYESSYNIALNIKWPKKYSRNIGSCLLVVSSLVELPKYK